MNISFRKIWIRPVRCPNLPTVYCLLPAFLTLVITLASCSTKDNPLAERFYLDHGWEFSQSGKAVWHPAIVPGTVHTDLLKNNLIPDPFYGCNEKDLQWIGRTDWVYRNAFHVDSNLLEKLNVNLVFEGLDTYGEVFLNGQKILVASNMFRKWEVDCKEYLVKGENLIEIIFESSENRFVQDSIALGYPLPGGRWNHSRKAAYHFGWDWGPKFVTAGIWKPVYLKSWNSHKVEELYILTKSVTEDKADLQSLFTIESAKAEKASFIVNNGGNGRRLAVKEIKLEQGLNEYSIDFSIYNPVLWWSNGLGEPHLYDLEFEIKTASGKTYRNNISYGIRTLEVVNEDDEFGKSLYVKLNGIPVFMKGANYIPQHSFVTEVRDEDYQAIIDMAVESNMNMLRVWGGGIYEKDIFYELCNRNGLLVWQDFMFACAMYPGNNAFVENVRQEAIHQVKCLRNFSNIALWCGNNEADEGWHNWGWQKAHNISEEDSATIWRGYKRIFHEILPDVVKEQDPQRSYISTSPLYGWGREKSLTHGSAHYWGVWWGVQPPEMYLEKVPRLMSEYGLQAMPTLSTIRAFQAEEEDFLFSPSLKCHQKHPSGYENINAYLEMENMKAENLEDLIYKSQLVQAKGIGLAIEAHRRAMPYCMGTLYWQLNDCWPVSSWSGTDVFGNRKALQYRVRELFKDILVTVIDHKGRFEVHLVSDRLKDTNGQLDVNIIDFTGKRTSLFSENITALANTSRLVISENSSDFFAGINKNQALFEAIFTDENGRRYVNQKFLATYGSLKLPEANITKTINAVEDGYNITLKSDAFAAHVQLYLAESHAWFSNNFVHLFPNEEISIFCKTGLSLEKFSEQLIIKHL